MEYRIQHYGLKSYSKLKPVSSINEEAILNAKSIRQSIGEQSIIGNSATVYQQLLTKKSVSFIGNAT